MAGHWEERREVHRRKDGQIFLLHCGGQSGTWAWEGSHEELRTHLLPHISADTLSCEVAAGHTPTAG